MNRYEVFQLTNETVNKLMQCTAFPTPKDGWHYVDMNGKLMYPGTWVVLDRNTNEVSQLNVDDVRCLAQTAIDFQDIIDANAHNFSVDWSHSEYKRGWYSALKWMHTSLNSKANVAPEANVTPKANVPSSIAPEAKVAFNPSGSATSSEYPSTEKTEKTYKCEPQCIMAVWVAYSHDAGFEYTLCPMSRSRWDFDFVGEPSDSTPRALVRIYTNGSLLDYDAYTHKAWAWGAEWWDEEEEHKAVDFAIKQIQDRITVNEEGKITTYRGLINTPLYMCNDWSALELVGIIELRCCTAVQFPSLKSAEKIDIHAGHVDLALLDTVDSLTLHSATNVTLPNLVNINSLYAFGCKINLPKVDNIGTIKSIQSSITCESLVMAKQIWAFSSAVSADQLQNVDSLSFSPSKEFWAKFPQLKKASYIASTNVSFPALKQVSSFVGFGCNYVPQLKKCDTLMLMNNQAIFPSLERCKVIIFHKIEYKAYQIMLGSLGVDKYFDLKEWQRYTHNYSIFGRRKLRNQWLTDYAPLLSKNVEIYFKKIHE